MCEFGFLAAGLGNTGAFHQDRLDVTLQEFETIYSMACEVEAAEFLAAAMANHFGVHCLYLSVQRSTFDWNIAHLRANVER